MGEDEDDDPMPSVTDVAVDARGNLRPRRILDALRGRRTGDLDLAPWLVLGLFAALFGGVAAGYADYGTLAGAAETAGWFLVAYGTLAVVVAAERIQGYYSGDEDVAVEELRRRYADGEIDLAAFKRGVELVYEEGPETVWTDDGDGPDGGFGSDGGAAGEGETAGDPVAILRERYARGEIDEAEFRRRMDVLGEPVEGDPAGERTVERET